MRPRFENRNEANKANEASAEDSVSGAVCELIIRTGHCWSVSNLLDATRRLYGITSPDVSYTCKCDTATNSITKDKTTLSMASFARHAPPASTRQPKQYHQPKSSRDQQTVPRVKRKLIRFIFWYQAIVPTFIDRDGLPLDASQQVPNIRLALATQPYSNMLCYARQ
jgi:hypothetical protein